MKKNFACFFFLILMVTVPATWAEGDEVRTVTAEGVAAILAGDMGLARDRAIKDAQRNAVEIAVGVLIDSETLSENYTLIRDEIYSRSTGYVEDYQVLDERKEAESLRVAIQARVRMGPLRDDLDRVIEAVERPRVLFMIAQQDIGQTRSWAWWEGTARMGQHVVEATLQQHFIDNHFLVVDHSLKRPSHQVSVNPSDSEAVALGRDYDAEVVVFGQAMAKDAGRIEQFDLRSCRAEISVIAVQVDNGHVLTSANANAAAVHIDPVSGATAALRKASEKLAKTLVANIIERWAKPAAIITLDIVDITRYPDFVRFKGLLKEQVRGVSKVYQRGFQADKANLEVTYRGTAQDLADELALKEFESFHIDLLEASQNRLKLKFVTKPE
ncbi:MAG: flagellar assembly protein T N-terminal domain-containing protein [Desulfobacterales bacterium]|nr:MAG: flagellar assembly protein T N-terminal domain-containing protein [Desulfobacterales bacterium]